MRYDNSVLEYISGSIHYRLEGSGEPALVLLHGLGAHSGSWRKVMPELGKTHMVIAPSLPFAGNLSPEKLAARHVELVRTVLIELNVRRFSIIGNSLGGMEAMMIAVEHGNQVCSVVLEDSAGAHLTELLRKYSSLKIPTLIVWGKGDDIIPAPTGKIFKNMIHSSDLVMIDAGHVPHWETPSEFILHVYRFLNEKGC